MPRSELSNLLPKLALGFHNRDFSYGKNATGNSFSVLTISNMVLYVNEILEIKGTVVPIIPRTAFTKVQSLAVIRIEDYHFHYFFVIIFLFSKIYICYLMNLEVKINKDSFM
jgi:hypothetical protein